jgi:hydroxyacylglutathione hydrolase
MYIQQLYTNCLAEAAYYIESNGEAAIIDPLRDTQMYSDLAKSRNAKIKYVFETHFHADFVSGHLDLAKQNAAQIIYGPGAKAGFKFYEAKDNEIFKLGNISLQLLHTPGHTLESSCILLLDENKKKHAVFTGDTLFVGDVGRPDLAVKSAMSQEDLAGMLYDSLHTKITNLPDEVIVYPGHGAGSACGKNIGKETSTTIGIQKKSNYALCCSTKESFIKQVCEGLEVPPAYFFIDAQINKNGYESLDHLLHKNKVPMNNSAVLEAISKGAILLDTRAAEEFEKGYIPGAINIGLNGQYAVWVGALLSNQQPIIVVANKDKEEEAIIRLARVGYENVLGYIENGIESWKAEKLPIEKIECIEPQMFEENSNNNQTIVVDVRNKTEWNTVHIANAKHIPLAALPYQIKDLDPSLTYLIHCAGGYRSMMASSLFKKHGIQKVKNVNGGIQKMIEAGVSNLITENND